MADNQHLIDEATALIASLKIELANVKLMNKDIDKHFEYEPNGDKLVASYWEQSPSPHDSPVDPEYVEAELEANITALQFLKKTWFPRVAKMRSIHSRLMDRLAKK